MKALTFKHYGKSPEVGFADLPRPAPKPGEILVQVHAASVKPIDNMIPTGLFRAVVKLQLPATLGSDLAGVVVDHRKQDFEAVLRDYDAALGTVRGDSIEKAIGILKAHGQVVSLVGPLDVAFARARRLNFILTFVFALLSRKIMRLARKRNIGYSFLFARADGEQLARIGKLLEAQRIRPVIDRVFAFERAGEALAYLAQGRSRGKVVVQMR